MFVASPIYLRDDMRLFLSSVEFWGDTEEEALKLCSDFIGRRSSWSPRKNSAVYAVSAEADKPALRHVMEDYHRELYRKGWEIFGHSLGAPDA